MHLYLSLIGANREETHHSSLWIKNAQKSDYAAFRSFANGIQDDYNAIKAALTLDISNGQTEGQVNR